MTTPVKTASPPRSSATTTDTSTAPGVAGVNHVMMAWSSGPRISPPVTLQEYVMGSSSGSVASAKKVTSLPPATAMDSHRGEQTTLAISGGRFGGRFTLTTSVNESRPPLPSVTTTETSTSWGSEGGRHVRTS